MPRRAPSVPPLPGRRGPLRAPVIATGPERRAAFRRALRRLRWQVGFALEGYAAMVPRADPRVDRLLLDWREAHRTHAAELAAMARRHGAQGGGPGRAARAAQRAVIGARALVAGIGRGALRPCVDGEERTLDLYDDAIAAAVDATDRRLLERQRAAVVALHGRTRDAAGR